MTVVLITNDDGIFSDGLLALARRFESLADVYIAAPTMEKSAQSHAITIDRPLRIDPVSLAGLRGVDRAFAIDGTPADCVKLALDSILPKKPDWVISGINLGANLGQDTLYSGTVSAAMEGVLGGCRAMAISIHNPANMGYEFETAAEVAAQVFKQRDEFSFIHRALLNINVPNVVPKDIKGIRGASLGFRNYDDAYLKRRDPKGRLYYWLGAQNEAYQPIENSDCHWVEQGYAAITVLQPTLFAPELQNRLDQIQFCHLGDNQTPAGAFS